MERLLFKGLAAVMRRSKIKFLRQVEEAPSVQEQFLRSLLRRHQFTAFGQEHGLADIQTIDQFQERLPVQPYSGFRSYTQRMSMGEPNVLTADPLIYFNISSGSTGEKKLIPVTQRSRQALANASRTSIGFAADTALRNGRPLGKMLFPLSSNSLGHTPSGIPYAPVSTSDLRLTNPLLRQVFTYPFEVFQISDTAARTYMCLLFALRNASLRIISATFPVSALQMCNYLECHAEEMIQDLETGEIAQGLKLEPELRAKFERQCSAVPARAAQLRHQMNQHGRLTPHLAWPDLSFMITARGGTSNFYFERFPEYFGDLPIFGGVYACAEGTMGVHQDFNTDAAILSIESGFYEFIPEDQWEVDNPKTVLPWEVTVGDRYRIVLTNYAGFYRYDLGDVVEIAGFVGQAPTIIFRHRRGGVMSSSTEKTTEFQVIQVMQILQKTFQLALENFCITLSKDCIPSHYLVNIELAPGAVLPDPETFLQQFDDTLKDVSAFYAIKRRDQIPLPRLRILEPGSFEHLRQRMVQQGIAESQLKFPHVTEDRNFLDGLSVQHEARLAGDRLPQL
ncbi:MAG: GH3 auxin-responsive promoter family protein [Synechococcales cyanobacterium K44_A2020_017]|nr:GH3 auxin-responsive promoter family protein [Synechococcales cyanobacterium K32_A2020_035]MBF2095629.1 GH3 auxin-responsive promoter family protein [Synechococcales cyanobacterium K44_A2020_017]